VHEPRIQDVIDVRVHEPRIQDVIDVRVHEPRIQDVIDVRVHEPRTQDVKFPYGWCNTHIYFCFISSSNAAMHYIMRKIVFL
ncbi:MAG: hypothetical protein IJS08_08385, partial [Victivallales bacterium]|nr:hypothetical protein [Victivallales bacterium]